MMDEERSVFEEEEYLGYTLVRTRTDRRVRVYNDYNVKIAGEFDSFKSAKRYIDLMKEMRK